MKRRINIFKSLDWLTILLFICMVGLGWMNIYASEFFEANSGKLLDYGYGKQLLWIVFAIVIAIMIIIIDSKFYSWFSFPLFGVTLFLLLLVLVIGTEIKGAKSWIKLGFFQIQPSEFAKFATCLALAKFLSTITKLLNHLDKLLSSLIIIAVSLVIMCVPAFLILLQPDAGSMLVYVSLLLVLYREGYAAILLFIGFLIVSLFIAMLVVNKFIILLVIVAVSAIVFWVWHKSFKHMLVALMTFFVVGGIVWSLFFALKIKIDSYYILVIAGIISTLILMIISIWKRIRKGIITLIFVIGSIIYLNLAMVLYNALMPHQQKRINVTLGIEQDISGAGWNLFQSKLAIGSGGLIGKGFLQGTQTKGDYVPEQSTDFIFCTIGEEWGFIGTTVVIVLFAVFLLRLIHLAERQRSDFTRIFGYGVISIFFVHIAINISMTIGLFPVIGIPLPFFSYGGSSLWGFTILLFIFLRLDASRLEYLH